VPDTPRREEDETPISHLGLQTRQLVLPEDISQRLTAEERAGFFFTLVDATADAIIAHRPDGSVVYANEAAAALLGYGTPADLLGLPPYGWIGPEQLKVAPRRIERVLADGLLSFESEVRMKDGTLIPTEVRTRRVDTPLGPMMIAVVRDISQRVRNRAALEYLAYHDGLTDLSNRIHLEDRLSLAIADARRYGDRLAMAYIDLDRFKPVNDRFGHAAGDDVLVEVAKRLREGVREQDTVARLGGDEFVVLFPRLSSQEEVESISQRLVERIMEPISVGEHSVSVAASIGIAIFDMREDDSRSLLVKADTAMYAAKFDPGHPWLVYHSGMTMRQDGDSGFPRQAPALGTHMPRPARDNHQQ
jgi:diguanylate cyclase (GGDEF)-like protein/PAS domain S-box-containing protein